MSRSLKPWLTQATKNWHNRFANDPNHNPLAPAESETACGKLAQLTKRVRFVYFFNMTVL